MRNRLLLALLPFFGTTTSASQTQVDYFKKKQSCGEMIAGEETRIEKANTEAMNSKSKDRGWEGRLDSVCYSKKLNSCVSFVEFKKYVWTGKKKVVNSKMFEPRDLLTGKYLDSVIQSYSPEGKALMRPDSEYEKEKQQKIKDFDCAT